MALARYYVANDLGAEALGVLRLMAEADQMAEQVPSFRTLRAQPVTRLTQNSTSLDSILI